MAKIIQIFLNDKWEQLHGTNTGYGPEFDGTPEWYVEKVSRLSLIPMRIVDTEKLEEVK